MSDTETTTLMLNGSELPATTPVAVADGSNALREGLEGARDCYSAHFGGAKPVCVVRAPGRVNLIGEHIDYNGYPVLPMAIEQSIFIAASHNADHHIHIVNSDPKYAPYSCSTSDVEAIVTPPRWHDYVLCGIRGVKENFLEEGTIGGMNLAVSGSIPPSAGLSSSSALVCCAAVATYALQKLHEVKSVKNGLMNGDANLHGGGKDVSEVGNCEPDGENVGAEQIVNGERNDVADIEIPWSRLAQVCATSEKHVGTEGGGMDQAACLLSKPSCAQLISFNPLRCEEVSLPAGATFVVANSLQDINKAATSDFNCRVMECRLACYVLAKTAGIDWHQVQNLASLQDKLGWSLERMAALVRDTLNDESYPLEEVANALGISEAELIEKHLSKNTRHIRDFKLRPRALHVFEEASRVYEFKRICDDWKVRNKATPQGEEAESRVLRSLGALLSESHESLRVQYECSHPALDRLVELSKELGLGARLTGAGWGGCTIALVPRHCLPQHCVLLAESYYRDNTSGPRTECTVFDSPPAAGARVMWE